MLNTNLLTLEIKTLRGKKTIPFTIMPEVMAGKLTLLVDENNMQGSFLQPNRIAQRQEDTKVYVKIEELEAATSFPNEHLHILNPELLKVLETKKEDIDNIENEDVKVILKEFYEAKEKKDEEVKKRTENKEQVCSGCELASLKRSFIPKFLKYFDTPERARTRLTKDAFNALKCDTKEKASKNIEHPQLLNLNNKYFEEVKTAESNPVGCTQCQLNGIKAKYKDIIKQLTSGTRLQETLKFYK